jgi:colanic acid/amylovoran biosynthesis glycosyltransferase
MFTVGYVLPEFPVHSETFVGNDMRAMSLHGNRVVPICLRLGGGECQPEDVELVRQSRLATRLPAMEALQVLFALRPSALRAFVFAAKQKRLPRGSLMWNAVKIARIASAARCDHLHAHFAGPAAAHAIVAARLIGATVSFICHGHDVYEDAPDLAAKLVAADFVVSTCNDMTTQLKALEPKVDLITAGCGIDPERFQPRQVGDGNGRLLLVGRLVEQKGIDDVLTALSFIDEAERPGLDIIGLGPLLKSLQHQRKELGLEQHVAFLGSRANKWIATEGPRYMGFISAFKPASDGQRDSSPVVIKEAMAMGLPIIATAFMGVKETVGSHAGELVGVGDVQAIAAAIRRLRHLSVAERAEVGRHGRLRVERSFSLAAQAEALTDAIRRVRTQGWRSVPPDHRLAKTTADFPQKPSGANWRA